jgi:hypothetical protein
MLGTGKNAKSLAIRTMAVSESIQEVSVCYLDANGMIFICPLGQPL